MDDKGLDNQAKKCVLFLEELGESIKCLKQSVMALDLCGTAGVAVKERRKAKERKLNCTRPLRGKNAYLEWRRPLFLSKG